MHVRVRGTDDSRSEIPCATQLPFCRLQRLFSLFDLDAALPPCVIYLIEEVFTEIAAQITGSRILAFFFKIMPSGETVFEMVELQVVEIVTNMLVAEHGVSDQAGVGIVRERVVWEAAPFVMRLTYEPWPRV